MNYGAVDKAVEETERADVASDEKNLRDFCGNNDVVHELFEDEYDEPATYDRDEEMLDIEDDCDEDDRPAPSAPPLAESSTSCASAIVDVVLHHVDRQLANDWSCSNRCSVRSSSIGRIPLARLRRLIQKLEPRRANPRALDQFGGNAKAVGTEDISLSNSRTRRMRVPSPRRDSTTPGVKRGERFVRILGRVDVSNSSIGADGVDVGRKSSQGMARYRDYWRRI